MKTAKSAPWIIGTALLSVVILVLAWMFGVSPQLQTADQARADADAVRLQNVRHAQRLEVLREQAQHLDEYKEDLAAIRVQIPTEDGEPSLLREIASAAATAGVFVVKVGSDVPSLFMAEGATPEVPVEPVPAPGAEGEDSDTTEGADTGGTAVVPAPAGVEGFVAVPFTVTVLGSFVNTIRFVQLAQESLQRLYMVTEIQVIGQRAAPPGGGKPQVNEGDAEFTLTGYVYVLQEDLPDEGTDAGTEEQPASDVTQN